MGNYFVSTSAERKTWDLEADHIIFAESGCAIEILEKCNGDSKFIIDNNRWEDCKAVSDERVFLDKIQDDIIRRLCDGYNECFKQRLTVKDVDRLLYPWLDYYIETMYYKFMTLEDIQNKYKDIYVWGLDEKDYYYCNIPMDFMTKVATDDWYNLQLYTLVAKYKGIEIRKFIAKEDEQCNNSIKFDRIRNVFRLPIRTIHYLNGKKNRFRSQVINALSYNAETVVINPTRFLMTYRELLGLMVRSKGKIGAYYFDCVSMDFGEYDQSLRREFPLDTKDTICDFEEFLLRRLVYDIPLICMEGIRYNLNDVNSTRYTNAKRIISVSDAKCDYRAKAFILGLREKCLWYNIEIGGPGNLYCNRDETYSEERISDIYYTNGWIDAQCPCEIRPLYNPRFLISAKLNKRRKLKGDVLYGGTFIPRYQCIQGFAACRNPKAYYEHCFRIIDILVKLKINLTVRLYHNAGWDVHKCIEEDFPNVVIEGLDQPFQMMVRNYRLYICDVLSTTWGEAYAAGIPFMIVSDKAFEMFSAIGEYWMNRLRSCGIYHEDYKSAGEYIASIIDHVEEWWNDAERQNIIRQFTDLYARIPVNLKENRWSKEIVRISQEE